MPLIGGNEQQPIPTRTFQRTFLPCNSAFSLELPQSWQTRVIVYRDAKYAALPERLSFVPVSQWDCPWAPQLSVRKSLLLPPARARRCLCAFPRSFLEGRRTRQKRAASSHLRSREGEGRAIVSLNTALAKRTAFPECITLSRALHTSTFSSLRFTFCHWKLSYLRYRIY
jgi:hypothetical protein